MNNVVLGAVTAYGLALREGFVGTLQDWLDSLHARIGANGNWWVGNTDTGVLARPTDLQALTEAAAASAASAKADADRAAEIVAGFEPGHEHDASVIVSGVLPVERGGTGVGSMTGTDYTTYRPRGSTIQTSIPSSVPSGCIVFVCSY